MLYSNEITPEDTAAAERLTSLHLSGLTLQEVADALNEGDVPNKIYYKITPVRQPQF